jgi:TetR/AcrR family transcriptional repressor of nem operon
VMTALQGGLLMAQATRSARPLELALNMALQHTAGYRPRPNQARRR